VTPGLYIKNLSKVRLKELNRPFQSHEEWRESVLHNCVSITRFGNRDFWNHATDYQYSDVKTK